ncbi:PREDICTED: uncharacterized protein C594.04c-like [Nicotiana attenuata]|uniref:Uncharacterized protein n=1 Tax=Nicotiana attenuata TaxID=49451 RepID=A0A1J6HW44_NICAT|nr:PREDICTED: uncharacterized protein C594.04c-like [Nicotiana attenuata]OIS96601.1 hypothetical protein A4A49_20455 [Nicotiana attenuata]
MATHSNFKNALTACVVPLPSILFYLYFLHHRHEDQSLWNWCNHHPLLLANLLFFLNVNVLFWFIALLQSSHWMIGLYWMVIPVMVLHFYANHPTAQYNELRSRVVILLTWVWSIRLIHSYFRRENRQWGVRQDWRFTDLSHKYGKKWWWVSFLAIYLSQQVLQMGICLPLYVVHTQDKPWSIWDFIAIVICFSGITIAYHADTQLHYFVSRNQKLKDLGQPMFPILDKGLWCYSRHPNYFGEQLWWWGLALIAWNLGQGWTFIGALINSICLAYVTVLVEKRMLSQTYRTEAYKHYQKTTSVLIPWFKSSSIGKDKKT